MNMIPAMRCKPSPHNPRNEIDTAHIAELKASIRAQGLLQNIIVVPNPMSDGDYYVIACYSRFQAVSELIAEDALPPDYQIAVDIRAVAPDSADALEIALSENVVRKEMNFVDECIAKAELIDKGRSVEAIATAFALQHKTVKQHVAIGSIDPAALAIVRRGVRDIDWARALTMADSAFQAQVARDVESNAAQMWRDGNEIRRYLTSEAIPAEHALFDLAQYEGRIIYDMFDTDKLQDRDKFWDLQNVAIQGLAVALEAEGWSQVDVNRGPVDLWRYRRSDDMAEAKAVIEVAPNGKVNVHKGLVDPTPIDLHDETDKHALDGVEDRAVALAGDAVPNTPALLEYAAAHRSAAIQSAVASNCGLAVKAALIGLIGHAELGIRAQDYRFPGSLESRTGAAFASVGRTRDAIDAALEAAAVPRVGRRDIELSALIGSLNDQEALDLFAKVVATKLGQPNAKRLDSGGIMNALGQAAAIDVRAGWTPDAQFFELMRAQDLRRLATHLLPANRQTGVLSAKKDDLVEMLSQGFADAAENTGAIDPVSSRILNTWVPGAMKFPAENDVLRSDSLATGDADPQSALFESDAACEDAAAALFDEAA